VGGIGGAVGIDELKPGLELGPTGWVSIEQGRVNAFAEATDDRQWIHVDEERAAAGPWGGTIAHGFLTLSLLVPLFEEAATFDGVGMAVNYGLGRVRFPAPVPVGGRVRAHFVVQDVSEVDGGVQATLAATVELEGQEKPVCVAEWLVRFLR
jgi:acyl dehydratase